MSRWRGPRPPDARTRAQGRVRQEDDRAHLRLRRHAVAEADAGVRLPAPDRHRPARFLGGDQSRRARRGRRPAHHLHAPALQEGEGRGRAHRPHRPRRPGPPGRAVPRRRGVVRCDRRVRQAARREPGHRAAPLPRLIRPDGDHPGHVDLPRFHNVFASEYWFEAYDLPYPKRVITDTGKTQYLFRINKGVEDLRRDDQPAHARGVAADPVRQHDLSRRRRYRRAVDGGDAQERRARHRGLPTRQVEGQVRRAVQGRALRFLRRRRLSPRLGSLPAHLPAHRPHPR